MLLWIQGRVVCSKFDLKYNAFLLITDTFKSALKTILLGCLQIFCIRIEAKFGKAHSQHLYDAVMRYQRVTNVALGKIARRFQ